MKKLIKKILKEEVIKEKEFISYFKIIDKLFKLNKLQSKDDLLSDSIYPSSDSYAFIVHQLTTKFGFEPKECNLIIGSYIETNLSNDQYSESLDSDYGDGIIISKPKKFKARFRKYIRGDQEGILNPSGKNYSRQEAAYYFLQGYDSGYEITDDYTETDDFDINDVYEI